MRLSIFKISTPFKLLLVPLVFFSCKSVFEKDISSEQVSLIIPQNNFVTDIRVQTFRWNPIEDALDYQIEIVSPGFDNIITFPIDSFVIGNSNSFTLQPGEYEWRITAYNGSSSSQTSPIYKFKIDSSLNLSLLSIKLRSPSNNLATSNIYPLFQWDTLDIADRYDFEIRQGLDWNSGTLIEKSAIDDQDYFSGHLLQQNLNEGEYHWGVIAFNDLSNTFTQLQTFSLRIDTTTPPVPILMAPDNEIISEDSTINFTWLHNVDTGSMPTNRRDSIYIYSDSLQTLHSSYSSDLQDFSTIISVTTDQTFFWTLKSYDEAGNTSEESLPLKFTLINE